MAITRGNSGRVTDPRWSTKYRDIKAKGIFQTIKHFGVVDIPNSAWLDLGCGNGEIAATIAPFVQSMIGVDPESWDIWSHFSGEHPNLRYIKAPFADNALSSNSFDVVICNQIYEHVPDPKQLISEICRVLKPGGYAYFAGPNLLFPVETHRFWPFIHWLPRKMAVRLMRLCGASKVIDANAKTYWQLQEWLKNFEIINAVPYIIRNPVFYGRSGVFWKLLSFLPQRLIHILTCLSPAFVFILRKPVFE